MKLTRMSKTIVLLSVVLLLILRYAMASDDQITLKVNMDCPTAAFANLGRILAYQVSGEFGSLLVEKRKTSSSFGDSSFIRIAYGEFDPNDKFVNKGNVSTDLSSEDELQAKLYSITSKEEADAEIFEPRPTVIPSNEIVAARFRALEPFYSTPLHRSEYYLRFLMTYDFYLKSMIPVFNSKDELKVDRMYFRDRKLGKEELGGLAWTVTLPAEIETGSQALLKVGLKNISNADVRVTCADCDLSFFFLNSIMIKKVDDGRVPLLTKKGVYDYYDLTKARMRLFQPIVTLKPGETFEFPHAGFDLMENYALSEPGEYELSFFTRQYCGEFERSHSEMEQEYPRKTIVRFTILPKSEDETSSAE